MYFNFSALWEAVQENALFVLVILIVIVGTYTLAHLGERAIDRYHAGKGTLHERKFSPTYRLALIGLFSAMAAVLMLFEIPLPFLPFFYKLDFAEIPILILAFYVGPVAGVTAEAIKVLLNLLIDGTTTAFVGEFASFSVGCAFIIPASLIYRLKKTKRGALLGVVTGTLVMTAFGMLFNAFYLIPAYMKLTGMPESYFVEAGAEKNSAITGLTSFILLATAPLNLIKGGISSVVVLFVYKRIGGVLNKICHDQ